MKRVLIAADDDHTRAWIHRSMAGMDVHLVDAGSAELSERLLEGEYDLVVADSGASPNAVVDVLDQGAQTGANIRAILVLEPEGLAGLSPPGRILADFMVRGGTSEELAARIRLQLWPGQEVSDADLVRVDDLVLNLATYQAYTDAGPIDFTYQEYALFAFLVTHANRAYSREMLLSRVWGSDYYGGARTVDVHVRRVRSKLGPELSRRLQTVRGVGYLWQG
jgi:DNA-binding response OmpR family regulator